METYMDCCLFSPINFADDFHNPFSTSPCYDASLITRIPEGEWVCEDIFHLTSQEKTKPCNEDESMIQYVNLPPLVSPASSKLIDRELGIFHLLKAYGEATEEGSVELTRVILIRLREKASPFGTTMERLSHYLVQQSHPQFEYLRHECIKNYAIAFRAFYEITPYSRFAHLVANAAINESVPRCMESVHIVDFDAGDGIQWPPLIAALGPHQSVRITCITSLGEDDDHRFRKTKERLVFFAKAMGLKLRVERMKLDELLLEKRTVASKREWLVFNCMVGLPHMGMSSCTNQRSQVEEFVRAAQKLLVGSSSGLLTYGTGSSDHVQFSDDHLLHSHALFESMEWHFQSEFSIARTTMECLFVGACVSSCSVVLDELPVGFNLKACKLSKQNILEAKEIVGGANYGVQVSDGNEMVLNWRGTPLVRVSAWA